MICRLMEKLTRHQAAEKLGVSEATISNYCEAGLLGSCRGKGNILYISAYDVERYRARVKIISADESRLIKKHQELQFEIDRVEKEVQELRHGMLFGKRGTDASHICRLIKNLYQSLMVPGLKKREVDVVCRFIGGDGIEAIANHFEFSKERARQILCKAIGRFDDVVSIQKELRDNFALERENEALKKENERLKAIRADNGEYVMPDYIKTLLDSRCIDYGLSIRALNVLKSFRTNDYPCERHPIETIGELITCPGGKGGLMQQRNCGRKTFEELYRLVADLGLAFKYGDEKMDDFYVRLEKAIKERRNG